MSTSRSTAVAIPVNFDGPVAEMWPTSALTPYEQQQLTYLFDRRHELAAQLRSMGVNNVHAIFCGCNSLSLRHTFSGSIYVAGLEVPVYFAYLPTWDMWTKFEYVGSMAGFVRLYRDCRGGVFVDPTARCSPSTHPARPVEVSETLSPAIAACHLLSLPREIRDMIVEYCLVGSNRLLLHDVVPPHNFRPAYASLADRHLSEDASGGSSNSPLDDSYGAAITSAAMSLQLANKQLHNEVGEGISRTRSSFPQRHIVGLTTRASKEEIRSLINGYDGELDVVIWLRYTVGGGLSK